MNVKIRTIKSLLYRVYSFTITWVILYLLLNGMVEETTIYTLIIEVVKTLNYFLFDYVWDKIKKVIDEHELRTKNN